MKKFYVYRHIRLDSGEIFYIGKGSENRAFSKRDRNTYWRNIVKKYGYKVEILKKDLTEKEALDLETKLIKSHKSIGLCKANLTLGGGGISGYTHTDSAKAKISKRSSGTNNPMYGLKRPHTSEDIEKMRGKNHPFSKKVLDQKSGTIFDSVGCAARELGYKIPTLINYLNGNRTNKTSLIYLEKYNGRSSS